MMRVVALLFVVVGSLLVEEGQGQLKEKIPIPSELDVPCNYDCETKKGGQCVDKWSSTAGEFLGYCQKGSWPKLCYCGYCFKRCRQDFICQAVGGKCQVRSPGRGWFATIHRCDKQRQCKCWIKCNGDGKFCQSFVANAEAQILALEAEAAKKG